MFLLLYITLKHSYTKYCQWAIILRTILFITILYIDEKGKNNEYNTIWIGHIWGNRLG